LDKLGVSFQVIKSGPYKDILSFDRELTPAEQQILQDMIDVSYQQFVQTVAKARQLEVEAVRSFADGRIFTGEQALALGVVDRLGTEEDARRWACELAGLNPDKAETFVIEEPKSLINRFLSRNQSRSSLGAAIDWLEFELSTQGQTLWLYRP
jgi:protease-4